MREIKFRCFNTKAKTFYPENHFALRSDGVWLQAMDNFSRYEPQQGLMVFMQYTGLKDKNCKEIYEGDIVRYAVTGPNQDGSNEISENYLMEVKFDSKRAAFTLPDTMYDDLPVTVHNESYEVIGNVYKNPTLLA